MVWNIQYSRLNLPQNICQILDSGQEYRLVKVLRHHFERIFTFKTQWNYTLDCFKYLFFYHIQLNISKVCYFNVEVIDIC